MSLYRQYQSATELLSDLSINHNFSIDAPIDVEKIAEILEISIVNDPSLEQTDSIGEISFDNGNAIIKINPFQNRYTARRRFTLAHEIAHYCLHSTLKGGFKDSRRTMSRSESYWDHYESQANNFAAQLLMPRQLIISKGADIIDEYKNIHRDNDGVPVNYFMETMSRLFNVSNKAMEYRLKSLKIIK